MLLAPELHTPYNAHVAPGAHRPIEAQLDTMRKVQRLQLGYAHRPLHRPLTPCARCGHRRIAPRVHLECCRSAALTSRVRPHCVLRLQLAMSIGDHKLAGCAVQQLYNLLTPLLRASQRSPFLLQPLALCHETLRAIPTEDLHSIKRAPQLLT